MFFLVTICSSALSVPQILSWSVNRNRIVLSHGMPFEWSKGPPPGTTHPSHQRQLHAVVPARRVVTEDNDVHQTQLVVQFATRQEEPVPNRGVPNGSHPVRCVYTLFEREFANDSELACAMWRQSEARQRLWGGIPCN